MRNRARCSPARAWRRIRVESIRNFGCLRSEESYPEQLETNHKNIRTDKRRASLCSPREIRLSAFRRSRSSNRVPVLRSSGKALLARVAFAQLFLADSVGPAFFRLAISRSIFAFETKQFFLGENLPARGVGSGPAVAKTHRAWHSALRRWRWFAVIRITRRNVALRAFNRFDRFAGQLRGVRALPLPLSDISDRKSVV